MNHQNHFWRACLKYIVTAILTLIFLLVSVGLLIWGTLNGHDKIVSVAEGLVIATVSLSVFSFIACGIKDLG